jgi:hypothetical protein
MKIQDKKPDFSKVKGFTYPEFIDWIEELVAEGKTSGTIQSGSRIQFTHLNLARMKRIEKKVEIDQKLQHILSNMESGQQWVIITEAWCGDSAQSLPVINKLAGFSEGKIEVKIILRDENLEWIEKYPTQGSLSIPKLISFDTYGNELFTWGPRPAPARNMLHEWKSNPRKSSWEDFETALHTWYAQDRGRSIQHEFIRRLNSVSKENKYVGHAA